MIIILEGMSTVGKTMVQNALAGILKEKNLAFKIIEQNEGLPPDTFEHLNPKKSLEFLHQYLKKTCQDQDKVYIFDRLHLSHFAITNGSEEDFSEIEKELLRCNPLLVLLIVDEENAKDRLEGAIKYRGGQWVEQLALRGDNLEAQAKWHMGTQKRHVGQFNTSKLPKVQMDATDSNFSSIAQEIFDKYIKKEISQ